MKSPVPYAASSQELTAATLCVWATVVVLGFSTTVAADTPTAGPTNYAASTKEIFRRHCVECHSDSDAQADVRILDQTSLLQADHVVPHRPDASALLQLISSDDEDRMPPTNRPSLTAYQVETVRQWIAAGATPFPPDAKTTAALDTASTVSIFETILRHTRSLPPPDREFYRYFSLRHLVDGGITDEALAVYRLAFAKAINHLSYQRSLVVPTTIDHAQSVLAVDLRQLGWHQSVLKSVDDANQTMTPFDMVLLEYPYAILPVNSDSFTQLSKGWLRDTKQIRPIAYLRADWFCSVVLQPPMYHDMLQLPTTLKELEDELKVDTVSNLRSAVSKRAGMTVSGVSRNNRVVERHPQREGYYWKSHDFQSNVGEQNILTDPVDLRPSGGEMIFRLPNGMQGYFVCDAAGRRLNSAPTSIVVDKFASDRVVSNGLGCIRCHNEGIKDFHDSVRQVLQSISAQPGFDKRKALALYETNEYWDRTVTSDRKLFTQAMSVLSNQLPRREPISLVTAEYLEGTLTVAEAAAELGVDAAPLKAICRAPGFTRLGLASLAADGAIRRDSWEDNFDAAVALLGLGRPLVALDGNLRRHFVPTPELSLVKLRTNKPNGIFEPGDRLRIVVANETKKPIFIELVGTSVDGQIVRITNEVFLLEPDDTFTFPEADDQFIEVQGQLGQESITLFASTERFEPGTIYRGTHVADRMVHRFLDGTTPQAGTGNMLKKTIEIETK